MPGFDATGPPFEWGRGHGGRPGRMGWAADAPGWFRSGPIAPGTPAFSGDQELEFLRNQAAALKDELNDIENRVKALASHQ